MKKFEKIHHRDLPQNQILRSESPTCGFSDNWNVHHKWGVCVANIGNFEILQIFKSSDLDVIVLMIDVVVEGG